MSENKLAYENQQLTERLALLEHASQKRKMEIETMKSQYKKKNKKKKRKQKNKFLPPLPYGGMYGGMPQSSVSPKFIVMPSYLQSIIMKIA